MIRNVIFDLGAVLLNIDLEAFKREMARIRDARQLSFNPVEPQFFTDYEKGLMDTDTFFCELAQKFTGPVPRAEIEAAWSLILKTPIPESMKFIKSIQGQYRIFLLSNTNEAHRRKFDRIFEKHLGKSVFDQLFEKVYYSYEMGLVKPDPQIFSEVMQENGLKPQNTLFIDDNLRNIEAARALGISGWHFRGVNDWPHIARKIQRADQ